jgi:predicted lipoprotein with Yx(FWY)xxD motif
VRERSGRLPTLALIAVLAMLALAAAGCGGGDDDSGGGGASGGGASAGASGDASAGGAASGGAAGASGGGEASQGGGYGAGRGASSGVGAGAGSAPTSTTATGALVSLGSVPDLGLVLVDSDGMTLYDFHKDKGGESACYGACAAAWPPLLTEGEPQVGNGATRSRLGTTERKDGTTQVTYAGHPLYTFAQDKKPGEANGNNVTAFGAEWYAVKGSGEEPEG